jgi:predicted nucleotidyltransferase
MDADTSFTRYDYETEQVVHEDLGHLVETIATDRVRAILLAGSYGRGEGGLNVVEGTTKPANDYDVVVIAEEATELEVETQTLVSTLEVPTLDLEVVSSSEIAAMEPSMFHYDLRYGSTILYGDNSIYEEMPEFNPTDVTAEDGYRLVTNRMAGLLGGLVNRHDEEYVETQRRKLRLSWFDALLLGVGRYECSYEKKRDVAHSLLADRSFKDSTESARVLKLADEAYEYKFEKVGNAPKLSADIQTEVKLSTAVLIPLLEEMFGPISETVPYETFLRPAAPTVRSAYYATRLFSGAALPAWRLPVASLYCREPTIRTLVAAELHRRVEGSVYEETSRILRRLYGRRWDNEERRGQKVFEMWNQLFH